MAKVIILGPAPPLRGGIAMYNYRLAKEFLAAGHDCKIYSFSLQYPSFLFPGKTQFSTDAPPTDVEILTKVNSINPLNWLLIGKKIKSEKPDIVVVRYWLPLMAPALGTILRIIKKDKTIKIVCIADNVIPHEKRLGDKQFTKYFVKAPDAFITMSEKVMSDLRLFTHTKPAVLVEHPLYDNFGAIVNKEEARLKLKINNQEKIILFFGFIRKYKGLDLLLKAIKILKEKDELGSFRVLIAGEFYEDEKNYQDLINELDIRDKLILETNFIPDSEVKYYLCTADVLVQPYKNATQSGVTPLAYHFEIPTIVTNVGGLAALVPHEKAGLVCEPNPESIADAIEQYFSLGKAFFLPPLRREKLKYSWSNIVNAILNLANAK